MKPLDASVIKSTNATALAPLTRPIQCLPVGAHTSGVLLHRPIYIQMTFLG